MMRRISVLLVSAAVAVTGLTLAAPAEAMTAGRAASSAISRINAIRKAHHLPALRVNAAATKRAAAHASLVSRSGSFKTAFRGERSVSSQLRQYRYSPAYAAQVISWSPSLARLVGTTATWPRLKAQALSRTPTNVGVSVQYVPRAHRYVLSLVFARPKTTTQVYAERVLAQLNAERKAHRLRPLSMNSALIRSAHGHNLTMASRDQLSHRVPGERFFADRILRSGYNYSWAGENIGFNSDISLRGVLQLETMMYNEKPPNDGHRQNILSPHYTNVGIDVYIDSRHHKVWLTQDFGRR
jgi:uncharacterized protein YkwD